MAQTPAATRPGTAVEKKRTWAEVLEEQLPAFRGVLPNVGITAEQILKDYTMAMRKNPALKSCTPQSVIATIMEACELGLSLAPHLRQASPVPFRDECTLIIWYSGYISLMRRSGEVADVKANIVYEGEPFEMSAGTTPYLNHTPMPPSKRNNTIIGAYAVVVYKDGTTTYEFMWIEDIHKIRDKAPGAKNADSPWNDKDVGYFEMVKKTVIRRIAKRSPLSINNTALMKAVSVDEYNESGINMRDMIPTGEDPTKGETPKGLVESVGPEKPANSPKAETGGYPPADCPKAAVIDNEKCSHFKADESCDEQGPCLFKIIR